MGGTMYGKYVFVINFLFIGLIVYAVISFINIIDSTRYLQIKQPVEIEQRELMILLWNEFFHNYDYMFGTNGEAFSGEHRCPVDNCIFTYNKTRRPVDQFDVIVFHGIYFHKKHGPLLRDPSQHYAIVELESPVRFSLSENFEDYFNWTLTYRLDSDFLWPYYIIKNKHGETISPMVKPKWDSYENISASVNRSAVPSLVTKKKAAAWFVSDCITKNKRERYVKALQKYIQVDIYGNCGPFKCPRTNERKCFEMLKKDYYFFIAFENSHCTDYMTEKAYNGLQYDTIPVVFGRVNFTNYIFPHSYLDANNLSPQEMAYVMKGLMNDPDEYAKYFWWKSLQYTFHNLGNEYVFPEPHLHPFCQMCQALNDPDLPPKTYTNLKQWWYSEPYSLNSTNGQFVKPACVQPKQYFVT